ncbi:MAG: hypothetical protein MZV63_32135 [Marinilabiliales bacterium]|nr:hypothetical protein [Marinilabiliales bacterium]
MPSFRKNLYKFPGFFVQPRTIRKYNSNNAAHVLGYVGEVNDKMIEANPYYNLGDYIGISGIEQSYEEYLRGKKGLVFYWLMFITALKVHIIMVGLMKKQWLDQMLFQQ